MALRHAATREIGSDRRPEHEVKNGQAGPGAHGGPLQCPLGVGVWNSEFKASGMHAAPISSQRTSLRVFVRLDAHHLLMVAKKDREIGGNWGENAEVQDFSKSTSLGTSLATCTFSGKLRLEAGGQGRPGDLTVNSHARLFLGRPFSSIGP